MTVHNEKLQKRGLWLVLLCFLVASLSGIASAARPDRKQGVIIPDAERVYSDVSTDIRETEQGAEWRIPLPGQQAWEVLKRSLRRLGVTYTESGSKPRQLLTGWITWGYDAAKNTGHSKRPHFGSMGTTELHKFRFRLAGTEPAKIMISDAAYQKQVEIAPDSEYEWLEWRAFDPQPGAAYTFGRRLQGEYQAAMSLEPVSVVTPPSPPPRVTGPVITREQTVEAAADKAPERVVPPLQPAQVKIQPQPAVKPVQDVTPVAPPKRKPSVTTVATGLLVSMPLANTWDALLRALQELKIDIETVDRNQLLIVTRWVYANYDPKNQQLNIRSNDDNGWAFSWLGGGPQRHRFQLVVIDAGQGRTLVRAYHTGFQEQIDQTPDSSQTLLAWEDRKTDPKIASAFLRRLRIVDNR